MLFSWRRAGNMLHPHFMFTTMLVVFMSDFLIRGYDDPNIDLIRYEDLIWYQLATLSSFLTIVWVTSTIYDDQEIVLFKKNLSIDDIPAPAKQLVFWLATFVLAMELFKRLSSTDWDAVEVYKQMLGPRGQRDWDVLGEEGRGNALFQLLGMLGPISATIYAYLLIVGKGPQRFFSLVLFATLIFILVTDGSRTAVVLPVAALGMFQLIYGRTLLGKAGMIAFSVALLAYLTSLMYNFRSSGFAANTATDQTLVYHQDDSLYRAWAAYDYAEMSTYRWDAIQWYTTILANPIPRSIWPGKPLVTAEFYGGFKLDYVTNLFYGEHAAMFGALGGTIFSTAFAILLYRAFYASKRLLLLPMGLSTYVLIALYMYMVMRSTFNLVGFIYSPLIALLLTLFAYRFGLFLQNRQSRVEAKWARVARGG